MSGQELPAVSIEDILDVRHLKASLRSLHGFPMCMQQLLHKGNSLDDFTKLDAPMDLQIVLQAPTSKHEEKLELLAACSQGYLTIASLLVKAGANKNAKDGKGRTALMLTAGKGHVEIVRLLVEANADKDLQDCTGYTALMLAAETGHVDVARLLLDAGAKKDLQHDDGCTALMHAVHNGHVDIARLLVEAAADQYLQDFWGYTA